MSSAHRILIVHGHGFKPDNTTLRELTIAALRAGIERDCGEYLAAFDSTSVQFVYYGDLNNALLIAAGRRYDEALDVGDRRNALLALREISERKQFGIRRYDRLPGKSAVKEFIAACMMPIAGALGLWMWLCARRAPDAAAYLQRDPDYAVEVLARAREALRTLLSHDGPTMLISHGTGCMPVWDALWQLSHDPAHDGGERKLDVWLTLGAPLGDRNVRRRLHGASESGLRRFPTNVMSWFNVSAEDDYVSHDDTLADDFRDMMREHAISVIRDYVIYNHAVRYGRSNPHSSVGYYIHPRVTKLLADWLQPRSAITSKEYTPLSIVE
ncbi:MAG: hypothetical protein R3288_00570 [Woeseiaceae bacterium]|nr:hypothetical protein [Woeseiaceae bacterium]